MATSRVLRADGTSISTGILALARGQNRYIRSPSLNVSAWVHTGGLQVTNHSGHPAFNVRTAQKLISAQQHTLFSCIIQLFPTALSLRWLQSTFIETLWVWYCASYRYLEYTCWVCHTNEPLNASSPAESYTFRAIGPALWMSDSRHRHLSAVLPWNSPDGYVLLTVQICAAAMLEYCCILILQTLSPISSVIISHESMLPILDLRLLGHLPASSGVS